MTSISRTPVARLSTPGDIAATVPTLCGFVPHDSVVVLSLRGRRKRLGLTVRLDLPPPAQATAAAELLAGKVAQDGAGAAVVVVFADERAPELAEQLQRALRARRVAVHEVLHVSDGRWTSYVCCDTCCPPEGTPVPPVPALVEAERALDGRAVLASREALVRALAPPVLLAAVQAEQLLDAAATRWVARVARDGLAAVRAEGLELLETALQEVGDGRALDVAGAAELAVLLQDAQLRDRVATWALATPDALLALLLQLARHVVTPYDAAVCTLLAWVSYAAGDGARANVALDRALDSDPTYNLALLLRTALDGALPPQEIRRLLRQTAQEVARAPLSSPG